MIPHKKLKKVSDSIFQEMGLSENKDKPLEWRRNFNVVYLPLKNLKIITNYCVHETEFDWKEDKSANPLNVIKTNVSNNIVIVGILDDEQIRNYIYCVAENKEEEVFLVERVSGLIKVTIRSSKASEENEVMPAGLYMGCVLRTDFDLEEDGLYFELGMPEDHMLSLIATIKSDENAAIEVAAHLLSFTYEVDDFFSYERGAYLPRDIIINNSAPCFISWVSVTSKIRNHSIQVAAENKDKNLDGEEKIAPEQQLYQELLQSHHSTLNNLMTLISIPLNNVVMALWVLIVVIVANTIF